VPYDYPVYRLIRDGGLRELRLKLGLSVTMQAHMIGVQPIAVRGWETGQITPTQDSCNKVQAWYERAVDTLRQADIGSRDLVHVSQASQFLARSYVTLDRMCKSGALKCVDLGPLGLYVERAELGEVPQGV
jgi:predicted transcriptional regulator